MGFIRLCNGTSASLSLYVGALCLSVLLAPSSCCLVLGWVAVQAALGPLAPLSLRSHLLSLVASQRMSAPLPSCRSSSPSCCQLRQRWTRHHHHHCSEKLAAATAAAAAANWQGLGANLKSLHHPSGPASPSSPSPPPSAFVVCSSLSSRRNCFAVVREMVSAE